MKHPNESGELQYYRFTLWDRIKRLLRNLDAAFWYVRHERERRRG